MTALSGSYPVNVTLAESDAGFLFQAKNTIAGPASFNVSASRQIDSQSVKVTTTISLPKGSSGFESEYEFESLLSAPAQHSKIGLVSQVQIGRDRIISITFDCQAFGSFN